MHSCFVHQALLLLLKQELDAAFAVQSGDLLAATT